MIICINRVVLAVSFTILCFFDANELFAKAVAQKHFPLIMSMNIGAKNYDDPTYLAALSRPDVVILGFYPGWRGKDGHTSMREVVQAIKRSNQNVLVGQYTILSETYDPYDMRYADKDKSLKVEAERWWLRNAFNMRVQWTDLHDAWDINITPWTKPDSDGKRYPEWLAERDSNVYFKAVPEFDIWYFDNVLSKPPVKVADWNMDGKDDYSNDPVISEAHRKGNLSEWQRARELHPTVLFMGNTDDLSSPEYSGRLQGAFMEAVIGASWSMERWKGWEALMERYRLSMKHTASPHIVGFNVHGKNDDYQKMRYGLASCLMDDGYFSYTDEAVGYSSVPWFDEYDIDLGVPVDSPSPLPWENGVYRRTYEKGVVLVNPGLLSKTVTIERGYRRIKGNQAPELNDGSDVISITLGGKEGIILTKSFQSLPISPKNQRIK